MANRLNEPRTLDLWRTQPQAIKQVFYKLSRESRGLAPHRKSTEQSDEIFTCVL